MITRIVFLGVAVAVGVVIFRLLRAGRIREKYAALWIIVGAGVVALAVWPGLLNFLAEGIGVALPVNLLFFLAILLLLGVTLHLSLEASRLEDETRVLAERVALLSLEVRRLTKESRPPAPEASEPGAAGDA
nr:DUF2304 domain-containing protein [Propionibacterium sp.]